MSLQPACNNLERFFFYANFIFIVLCRSYTEVVTMALNTTKHGM